VLTPDCRPLAGARVDFWQADGNGVYDNDGYRLRGYQVTDGRGRYRLETVVPGRYEPRTMIRLRRGSGPWRGAFDFIVEPG
jgi:protocatechuate 3,4-dioxygenase beta subunit